MSRNLINKNHTTNNKEGLLALQSNSPIVSKTELSWRA
jgi:hypothetical protein